ncbi:hypothetical protein SteCoe_30059 [Stentor coeruleus]|uniref:Uncharacterized protein n=1 Tax=Stentor coeruleus TaxID=5963 RepID=A0A1R2B4D8_9CILI|nr:hypothetical protein SteCoe_30059 [Stentor coeruleus]
MKNHESLAAIWEREISKKIHKQKLEKIKKRDFKVLNTSLNPPPAGRKSNLERSIEISRENQILYEKLIYISERKNQMPVPNALISAQKCLNSKYKRQEEQRIIKENMHLVNKLTINNSELSLNKMIKDYEILSEYRDRISKKNFQDRIQKAVKSQGKSLNTSVTINSSKTPSQAGNLTPKINKSAKGPKSKEETELNLVSSSELTPIKEAA